LFLHFHYFTGGNRFSNKTNLRRATSPGESGLRVLVSLLKSHPSRDFIKE